MENFLSEKKKGKKKKEDNSAFSVTVTKFVIETSCQ